MLASLAFAGTVVLTGTCASVVKNNTVNFSIANSGNDSAYGLIVNPYISGANVIGNYSIARLDPGSTANFAVRLSNITAKGTYVDYFVVDYQQAVLSSLLCSRAGSSLAFLRHRPFI